eukprot:scaffold30095_cov90-Isochrysis_galbana.AAC.1
MQCKALATSCDETLTRIATRLNAVANTSHIFGSSGTQAAMLLEALRGLCIAVNDYIPAGARCATPPPHHPGWADLFAAVHSQAITDAFILLIPPPRYYSSPFLLIPPPK